MRKIIVVAAACTPIVVCHARADTTLTIATVNNVQMIEMQQLTPQFEKTHPGIHLRWVVLEENTLRERVTTDIATHGGQFDVLTIGNYEVPLWAKRGWLAPLKTLASSYDAGDILKPVRDGLSYDATLYALPFYAESAMTYYRTDLFRKAGLTMPPDPTYRQIRTFADRINNPHDGIYGICLRGEPGWGENMAYFTTLVTAMGGQWFNMNWKPTINTAAWRSALTYYDDILKADGPPGAASEDNNANTALLASGHCGMYIEATSIAGTLGDPKQSKVVGKVGYAHLPTGSFKGGPTWLWIWSLAIPKTTTHLQAATQFIAWATSKRYVELVASKFGWIDAPPGTRMSTYDNPSYKAAAPFAGFVLHAIETANPDGQTAEPRPYTGAQFVDIPEFAAIGTVVGQDVAASLTGSMSVSQALRSAQATAARVMSQAGYERRTANR